MGYLAEMAEVSVLFAVVICVFPASSVSFAILYGVVGSERYAEVCVSECVGDVECFFAHVGEGGPFLVCSLCLLPSCRTVGVLFQ